MNNHVADLEAEIRSMENEIERVMIWTRDTQDKLMRVQNDHERIGKAIEQVANRREDIDENLDAIRVDKHPKYLLLIKELANLENESEEDRKSEIHNFVEYAHRSSRNVYTFAQTSPYSTSITKTETELIEKEVIADNKPTSTRDIQKKKRVTTDWLRRMKENED